jgi:O-antigen/teichoic acid export membrane protein
LLKLSNVLKNLGSGTVGRFLGALLGVLLAIYMARKWSVDAFGQYSIIFNYFQLLQQAPLLGLHLLLVRDAAARPDDRRSEMVTAGSLGLVVSVPLAIGLGLIGQFLYPSGLHASFALVGVSLAPTALIMVIEMMLIGQERLSFVAFINILESALRFIVFVTIIYLWARLTEVILAFVAFRMATICFYLLYRQTLRLLQPSAFRWSILSGFLRQAPILFGILILSTAFSRFDVTFLSKLASDADVAVYSIAARLYDLALIVPGILMAVLLPILSRLHAGTPAAVSELCRLVLRYGLIFGMPAAICISFAARPIIGAVFGEKFAAAELPVQILMCATLVMAANQLMATVLLVFDLQRFDLPCLTAGCLALVVGLLVLIPALGIAGAALAALCGAMTQCVVRILIIHNKIGFSIRFRDLNGPLLAGVSMIAAMYLAAGTPVLVVPIGLVAYVAVLRLSRSMSSNDINSVKLLLASNGRIPERGPAPLAAEDRTVS